MIEMARRPMFAAAPKADESSGVGGHVGGDRPPAQQMFLSLDYEEFIGAKKHRVWGLLAHDG
jgi:hypothetical protein